LNTQILDLATQTGSPAGFSCTIECDQRRVGDTQSVGDVSGRSGPRRRQSPDIDTASRTLAVNAKIKSLTATIV